MKKGIMSILFIVFFYDVGYSSFFKWRVLLGEGHRYSEKGFKEITSRPLKGKWVCKTTTETEIQNKNVKEEMTLTCSNDNFRTELFVSATCWNGWIGSDGLNWGENLYSINDLYLGENGRKINIALACYEG